MGESNGFSAISEQEKVFVHLYHSRIKLLQERSIGDFVVYTKISLPYAILNNFYVLETLFHPLSVAKHLSSEKPDLSSNQIRETLHNIIVYELTSEPDKTRLSQVQLGTTINHFRGLERRSIA